MSKIEVDAITQQSGTTLTVGGGACKTATVDATTVTLGRSGGTVSLASGATQTGFGRTGTVDWQTGSIKTSTFTAANGEGYFANTAGGAFDMNLPAGVAGNIVSVADYTRTFQTNNLTITPNGSEKIGGVAANFVAQTEGQSITLVYVDATEGWINTAESTGQSGLLPAYITATGGTITTVCTDYKVHTFTGPGTFTVCSVGNPLGSSAVDYMVVAGGGGGAGTANPSTSDAGGGGGAGGYRESSGAASGCYAASPLGSGVSALPVSATGYPITVGGGGPAGVIASPGSTGNNSVFAGTTTITSAGGGAGRHNGGVGNRTGTNGGSGGGPSGGGTGMSGGLGNTPPTSPSQGFPGSSHCGSPDSFGGAGGGATQAGFDRTGPANAGPGGAGATSSINGTPTARAGGGGGGGNSATIGGSGGPGGGGAGGNGGGTGVTGTTNTGGGGGGGGGNNGPGGGAGGSGIVIIRYKFQ